MRGTEYRKDLDSSDVESDSKLFDTILELRRKGVAKRMRVLAPANDPFWPMRSRIRDAVWVSQLWREYINREIHPRGFHYVVLSHGLKCPWGAHRTKHPYEEYLNIESDFSSLCNGIRDALSWKLLPLNAIEEKRSIGLETWVSFGNPSDGPQKKSFEDFDGNVSFEPGIYVPEVENVDEAEVFDSDDIDVIARSVSNDLINTHLTSLNSYRFQPYYVAVVSEKSGLRSLAERVHNTLGYGYDFLNFEGQPSTIEVLRFLKTRIFAGHPPEHPIKNKKIRIFYLSDYDYAGRLMIPAICQKIIYGCLFFGESGLDIKLKQLALTREQVEFYDLPPAPVSDKKLGAKTLQDRWMKKEGKIIEIDALTTLHEGELEKIITNAVSPYIDRELSGKLETETMKLKDRVRDTVEKAFLEHEDEWRETRDSLEEAIYYVNEAIQETGVNEVFDKFRDRLDEIKELFNLDSLISEYEDVLSDIEIKVDNSLSVSSTLNVEEDNKWIFDSSRDIGLQAQILREYKP